MLAKILLFPYWLTLKVRHHLYNTGVKKVHHSEVPTICLGNITVGGTGKTPHTEMILKTLSLQAAWKDKNIAVLSRGHKRKSKGFQQVMEDSLAAFSGDEPLQIKKKFPHITVAVDKNRVEGCHFLCHPDQLQTSKKARRCKDKDVSKADVIILDDAFQHRSLQCSYNIVLIDYSRPVHKDNLLPIGHLRDLPERLDDADMLIVSKCPRYLDDWERQKWVESLGVSDFDYSSCQGSNRKGRKVTVLFTTIGYCPLERIFEEGDNRYVYSKKLILFSGIAKDTPLQKYLSDSYSIVKHFTFPDHHKYGRSDIRKIANAASDFPTAVIATTEKDSQRIKDVKDVPQTIREKLFEVPIEVQFLTEEEKKVFEATLNQILN